MNRVMASSRSCRSVIRVPSMSCACSSSDSKFIAPRPSGLRRRSALADHAVDEVVQAVDRGPVPQVARRRDAVGDGERPAESYRDFLDYDLERRRSEEHTSELQSQSNLVCRLLLEKKKKK